MEWRTIVKIGLCEKLGLIFQKATLYNIPIVFIDGHQKVSSTLPGITDKVDIGRLIEAWNSILSASCDNELGVAWKRISEICLPVKGYEENQFIQQIQYPEEPVVFCALGKTNSQFPWVEINGLINQKLVDKKSIPLHACGVMRNKTLFLFGGPSGTGKSTISQLSKELGLHTLDEDQILLKKITPGKYGANAWGYSLMECDFPIKAVFKISQSKENNLHRLSKAQTAKFLFQQSLEVVGRTCSRTISEAVFRFTTAMAQNIPGYELKFTKSPDFWDLIKAELDLE